MEELDDEKTEMMKMFVIMKKVSPSKFKRLKALRFHLPLHEWKLSSFNHFHEDGYLTIYNKIMKGRMFWILEANKSKRQYMLIK